MEKQTCSSPKLPSTSTFAIISRCAEQASIYISRNRPATSLMRNEQIFTISELEAEQYISTRNANPITFGLRIGGGRNHGDLPFYKLFSLGQLNDLQGYKRNRFTGESKAFINTELRKQLIQNPKHAHPPTLRHPRLLRHRPRLVRHRKKRPHLARRLRRRHLPNPLQRTIHHKPRRRLLQRRIHAHHVHHRQLHKIEREEQD